MKSIKNWRFVEDKGNHLILECDGLHRLNVFVLEHNMMRVLIENKSELRLNRTWSIAQDKQDVSWEGRDRLSKAGFTLPTYRLIESDNRLRIETDTLALTIHQPLWLEWEYKGTRAEADVWLPLCKDRKTGAYSVGVKDHAHAHYINRLPQETYYGLGEKTGDLNRTGRRFEMRNLDAMGYNAKETDPLYKHIPFYISRREEAGRAASVGVFYDNLANCWFDLGNELDNYHVPYRSYRAEDGDLDYYLFYGEKVADVSKQFVRLTGGTAFGPKWSLGYSGSTMQYTDAPNAQELLESFVDQCAAHVLPCDSFQLSSGYTSIGNKRYVFNWNTDKVPDPIGMSGKFHQAGLKLAANIKPCLLHDHPRFEEVKQQALFIKDSESEQPENSVFWDAEGSHLDFTNPHTVSWWKSNVTEQLLEKGIDSTWNDNNEYEIWDKHARCDGFGDEIPIGLIRPLQPLLMMRASYEAQTEFAPSLRPFLISRSGCPGMNRYVQTWTGDNRTNWGSLRYNIRMGLGMSLSGLYNIGHDVGGFSGERPDPELFVRWVQNGVMHPRFTIHSWNDDGSVNEPWMFPDVTPMIRDAMVLRYRLYPYLYNLLWKAHAQDEPMLRPTFLDHEHDAETFKECDDFLLGEDILVASVVDEGQRERSVYLPDNASGWYDFATNEWHQGGQTIILAAPLARLPLLIRAGSVLPTSERIGYADAAQDSVRNLCIYPFHTVGQRSITIFDDDGETTRYQTGQYSALSIEFVCDLERIDMTIQHSGEYQTAYDALHIRLPEEELRPVFINKKPYKNGQTWPLSESIQTQG
ncbi:TIM-barrel domain-containing protein [Marinomonas sp. 2405UD68-3]|uniref:glycoside hydrolase family 31 protein n=1 Tax=Marinomonas sp. 2405UD68-3 TaxID=3391835 RepID=UPI0039C966F3